MLDTHRLRVFLIAAETLNFSVAAKRLNMTQPSVSQHIQALEQQFGTELFIRSSRRLAFVGASRTILALQLSGEIGWGEGFEPTFSALPTPGPGSFDPSSGSYFGSLAVRLTF